MKKLLILILVPTAIFSATPAAHAQKAPEVGYVFPAGGMAGTTVEVHLGGYDWTPDMEFFPFVVPPSGGSAPGVQITPTGPLGPILIPPPPYWFGAKGRITGPPLAREIPAKLVLPQNFPAGPVYWQAANANGATSAGVFIVGTGLEVVEDENRQGPQTLAALPVTVSGRLIKHEEVDRYRFTAPHSGPITCDLMARRLGAKFMGVLEVRDSKGAMVADVAGTNGSDPILTFVAQKGVDYVVSISDVDFAGDRSFVYRLTITPGPRILGTLPAMGQAGSTREVEFVGIGLASGSAKLESVKRTVTFPANLVGRIGNPSYGFDYRLETPFGASAPYRFPLSDAPELVAFPRHNPKDGEPQQAVAELARVPEGSPKSGDFGYAITGVLDQPDAVDQYSCSWKKGQVWSLALEARRFGSPLDVTLAVRGPDGKELARSDDLPETTDAGLDFTVPADGIYQIVVSDVAGKSGSRSAIYRLAVRQPQSEFTLQLPVQRARVTLGGKFDLAVKAVRKGFQGPIHLTLHGVPAGVNVPANLTIPAGKTDLVVSLQAAADCATCAAHVTVTGSANQYLQLTGKEPGIRTQDLGPKGRGAASLKPSAGWLYHATFAAAKATTAPADVHRTRPNLPETAARLKGEGTPTMTRTAIAPITANLAPRSPDENRLPVFFLACTLKPLFKGQPVDQDTGRKVHRGSTFPAEVIVERLDGFQGEIVLQMAAQQSYQSQGITGGEVKVPPNVSRTVYPCYMPEWLESTRTSRMGMIGVAKVADPKGKIRYLTGDIAGFITMTMEGALLKIAAEDPDMTVPAGQPVDVHLRIARLTKLTEPAKLELRLPAELAGKFKAETMIVAAGQEKVVFRVTPTADLLGLHTISIRATALQDGVYPAISEATLTLEFVPVRK